MELLIDRVESPVGSMLLVADGRSVRALYFDECEARLAAVLQTRLGAAVRLRQADDPGGFSGCLRAYLAGDLTALDEVPVSPDGSPFQQRVWAALRTIPVGTTTTYGELAARLGQPTASRAVGLANGRNPVAVIVPCHRVIGSGGRLIGYAGGLARKRWLLEHEGVLLPGLGQAALPLA
jgi:methylated-DNA-[protein]-cysteine S-methyltransferase